MSTNRVAAQKLTQLTQLTTFEGSYIKKIKHNSSLYLLYTILSFIYCLIFYILSYLLYIILSLYIYLISIYLSYLYILILFLYIILSLYTYLIFHNTYFILFFYKVSVLREICQFCQLWLNHGICTLVFRQLFVSFLLAILHIFSHFCSFIALFHAEMRFCQNFSVRPAQTICDSVKFLQEKRIKERECPALCDIIELPNKIHAKEGALYV